MEAANMTETFYENGEFAFCYFGEIIKALRKKIYGKIKIQITSVCIQAYSRPPPYLFGLVVMFPRFQAQ